LQSRNPQISKVHDRAANKSKTTAATTARSAANRCSVACPKSFASAWRNCPADVEESAQWRAGFQTWEITGAIMTIAEYLAATALVALIVWGVLGLLMQES
jgi:hypothetical protein